MGNGIAAERVSELIGLIYDCAIDPGRWSIAVDAIRIELGGANATLDLIDVPNARSLRRVSVNIPPMLAQAYGVYVSDMIGMWGGVERMLATPIDRPISLARMVPDRADREDNRYHAEWKTPQGTDDTLVTWLARDAATVGVLGFGRLGRDGPFGDREFRLASMLIPHLQRTAQINRLLDVAAWDRATFAALIDALSAPVLLIDEQLRVVHANTRARELLEARDLIYMRDDRLAIYGRDGHRALTNAMERMAAHGATQPDASLSIPLRHADGSAAALHILPLGEREEFRRSGARAAVFVAQPVGAAIAPSEMVAALFGLTPSEARVFQEIGVGRSVRQTAATLHVEESTVRTHLLRLYDKTGVRRQAELVRMAASLGVPVTH